MNVGLSFCTASLAKRCNRERMPALGDEERVRAFSKQANAGIKVKWFGVGEQATFFLAPNLRAATLFAGEVGGQKLTFDAASAEFDQDASLPLTVTIGLEASGNHTIELDTKENADDFAVCMKVMKMAARRHLKPA